MLLLQALLLLVWLAHTESVVPQPSTPVPPPAPPPVPQKCSQCANADLIDCGAGVGQFYSSVDNNADCVCGFQLSSTYFACDRSACCENTPSQCCNDPTSTNFVCFGSQCNCGGGTGTTSWCKTPIDCCPAFLREDDRHLTVSSDLVVTENDVVYSEYLEQCGELQYSVSLYIEDSHMYALAKPESGAETNSCPLLVAHSNFSPETKPKKELLLWKDAKLGVSRMKNEKLFLGTFRLVELAEAFEKAAPGGEGPYDILTNNCSNIMIEMANQLGVEINLQITSYVARRLFEDSGKELVQRIRDSASFSSFIGHRRLRAESDDGVDFVQLVVEARAAASI